MVIVLCSNGHHVGFIDHEVTLQSYYQIHSKTNSKPKKILSFLLDDDQSIRKLLQNKILAENYALNQCQIHTKESKFRICIDIITTEFQFDRKKILIYIKKYDTTSPPPTSPLTSSSTSPPRSPASRLTSPPSTSSSFSSTSYSIASFERFIQKLKELFKINVKVIEIQSIKTIRDFIWKYYEISKLNISFNEMFTFNLTSQNVLSSSNLQSNLSYFPLEENPFQTTIIKNSSELMKNSTQQQGEEEELQPNINSRSNQLKDSNLKDLQHSSQLCDVDELNSQIVDKMKLQLPQLTNPSQEIFQSSFK